MWFWLALIALLCWSGSDLFSKIGENIYPKEIEEFIYTHPKVSDVQVIGVPDEQYGEEIMACVPSARSPAFSSF